jgi:hypothetical protein
MTRSHGRNVIELGKSTRDKELNTLFPLHTNTMTGHLELILPYFSSALPGAFQDKTLQVATRVSSPAPALPQRPRF